MSKNCIQFLLQDITKVESDAIVNATDPKLSGCGGVDKAIHTAAGSENMPAALRGKNLRVGEAIITPGYDLPAKYVIHTVGPRYRHGSEKVRTELIKAYISCMEQASENGVSSITFCSISTGTYRYPIPEAVEVAISTILRWLAFNQSNIAVAFAFTDNRTKCIYEDTYMRITDKI